jgi:hypothetical protein
MYIQIINGKCATEFMRFRVGYNWKDLEIRLQKFQVPPHRDNFWAS